MNEKRSVTSARGLRRGDSYAVDQSLQAGNLVRVKEPKMLTLVNSPANQTGFKILRSDQGEAPMNAPVIRRTRRSDASPVLRLAFPEGSTETTVTEALKNYGLSGYRVESNAEGVFTATRSDLQSISPDATMEIKLNDEGLVATVARSAPPVSNAGDKPHITLASVEFDSEKFTSEDVKRWAEEKSVDGEVEEPQNAGDCYVVRRSATPEGEEVRRMTLEDGVTAVIVRSDLLNIPAGYIAVVSEAAYGGWGWGQLDFTAAMADATFSESMRASISMLEDVLRNIVVYSSLPLEVRKELALRALAQYGEYVGAVMDSLPRQLLVSVTRSATPTKEKVMSKEASGAATNQAATETPKKEDTPAVLTRADVEAIAAAAATAAVAAAMAPKTEPAAPAAAAPVSLTRADLTEVMAEAMKPLAERMEKLEGVTVVRSAPEANPEKPAAEKPQSVFRGALPNVRVKSQAA